MDFTDLLLLSPSAEPVIAASRAGCRGVLDLEFSDPASSAALRKVMAFAPDGFAVKLGPGVDLPAGLPSASRVILPGNDPALAQRVLRFHENGAEVLVEAVSIAEALAGVTAGADGVILKGHEASGRVGPDTSFVLIQKWRKESSRAGHDGIPFWVRGGVGPNTAAACFVAGARGVVLDSQLILARESAVSDDMRKRIAGMDGGETVVIGERLGEGYRLYGRPDSPAAQELLAEEERLLTSELSASKKLSAWRQAVRDRANEDPAAGVWMVGQDVATAAALAAKFVTVAGIAQAVAERAHRQVEASRRVRPLAKDSALAASHGTRFPILQGPMTRVSDTAGFAQAVAAGDGLPFLALALMRKAEIAKLLTETKAKLGAQPWGVGILGFVPPELRAEQLEAVRAVKPPFAIIAGGRPDQAKELERDGTKTYLHVPSPGLLRMFLKDGARRFIFEGRECGGHVGPRTSFALWETMAEVLAEHLTANPKDDIHAVFAGGIHDAVSAEMVAALAADLAERGAKVGVLLGTAYLFTREAVESGAITAQFQREALGCGETVLLETGPGHAIRCVPTPYAETFEAEKRRLRAEGKSPMEVGLALERMNLGRLRVASKGVDRAPSVNGNGSGLAALPEDEQRRRGMYMIGQVAGLRDRITTVAELHAEVCGGLSGGSKEAGPGELIPATVRGTTAEVPPAPPPCDVAIVGMSCFFPKAIGAQEYWENILTKTNAVIEIPPTHWDWKLFYDPDPRARDKIVSKWGGFMGDAVFEPLKFGITPKSIPNIEPLQLLLLEAVRQAIADAGYEHRPFCRERTAAILGIGGGGMPLSLAYGFRACMPMMDTIPGIPIKGQTVIDMAEGILPEWTEDSFPGILLNVAAGRVSNRFNLGGPNMAIDAACGSSLAALYAGLRELSSGTSDVAVVMGGDAVQTPYAYVAFSKTHALSPKGRCRPFDAAADGIALAEGVGVVILKRLGDAERDGDRIYAVIKGIGASSDGRDKGLTAPRAEGQLRALNRAYSQARISPKRVGLVEAHGTGTVVGDQTEAQAIGSLFRESGAELQSAAIGSVKSMIGHSKCAAGLAGLIKATFALHHKVLPPTLVEKPNPRANLDGGPLYLNTEPRPWVHGGNYPRTAGVSAFGFGGTNFHTVLEEYTGDFLNRPSCGFHRWPAELVVIRRTDRPGLIAAAKAIRDALAAGARPGLADLAASAWQTSRSGTGQPTLAVVASSLDDLRDKLTAALDMLAKPGERNTDPRGIYFNQKPAESFGESGPPRVAFLFPGQGSQYPDMLAQTAIAFPEVRDVLDQAERTLTGKLTKPLGRYIYPPSPFSPEQEAANRKELQRTEVAQPALGATSLGMARLLAALGVEPDFLAGHSYGEYVALAAAGALTDEDLIRLSHRRGVVIRDAAGQAGGGMIAVEASVDAVTRALHGLPEVWPANHNSPSQTVLAGSEAGLKAAEERLQTAGLRSQRIPVACGFHSPLIAGAKVPLALAISEAKFAAPRKPVFSNTAAAPHPSDPDEISRRLADHLASPVRFRDEIEAMHTAGARLFLEVGPNSVLTGLVSQTLAGKPHLAFASDQKGRPGLVQLSHLLGQLLVHGTPVNLDRLYQGRAIAALDLTKLGPDTGKPKLPPTAWLVNGVRSRPINGPEPRLLGQPLPEHGGPPFPAKSRAATQNANAIEPKPAVASVPQPSAPMPKPSPNPATQRTPMTNPNPTPTAPITPTPSANGHPAPPSDAAQVMVRFQEVMAKFLDTQRSVMLGYLGAGSSLPAPSANGSNGHYSANGPLPVASTGVPSAIASRLAQAPAPIPSANGHQEAPKEPLNTNGQAHLPTAKVEVVTAPAEKLEPTAKAGCDRETLLAQLLDLVSDRTGYPKEALSIDLDLEADLGIDSIKRVEILGALAEGLGVTDDGNSPALEMEKLSTLKTLRAIADYVSESLSDDTSEGRSAATAPQSSSAPVGEVHPGATAMARSGARQGEVMRLVVNLIDAQLPERPKFPVVTGTVLLTDDRQGIALELADRLAELDVKTAFIRHGTDAGSGAFVADLTNPEAVAELLGRVREKCGPVAGLIHLLPLSESADGETPEARTRREVKSLYLLARGLEADIRAAGKPGGAVLLAVTGMGGRMGYGEDLPEFFFAGHGGVAGFTKSLGHEWPDVTVRVVDLDPETPATEAADLLLAELGDPDGPFEIGRFAGERLTWQCEPGPLDSSGDPDITFDQNDTILITGGARGITAKIAAELGRRHRPKLVLVGSSPAPKDEPSDTAGLTAAAEIKAALMKRLGPDGKPAAVEAAYRRLIKDREIRANLEVIRATGAPVEYREVDVRDPAAFGAILDELNRAGGISAVIHGAGVIEDKLLKDKTPESFERVVSTKVDSAFTLVRKLDPKRLKAFALFASVASRYGNRGQSDYAAANEVLGKLACDLDRRWPGRVCAIAWGPWSEVGMVADLEKHLVARGLKLIDPAVGAKMAVDELTFGAKGTPEVVIAGGTEIPSRPAGSRAKPEAVTA